MTRFALFGALFFVGLILGCSPQPDEFLLGGIQVNEPDHGHWFRELRAAGMNTVSATVYAKQGDWDSDNLWWEEDEPGVLAELRGAEQAGLESVLILRVALDHAFPRNRFLWHGMIYAASDELLDRWFSRYRAFVLEWARIAQAEGVDLLAVGSELNALASTEPVEELPSLLSFHLDQASQQRRKELILRGRPDVELQVTDESAVHRAWAEQVVGSGETAERVARLNRRRARIDGHWKHLIREVREIYTGPLTFAANFDQYREVGFWSGLDFIGINAYFPLRESGAPAPDLHAALVAGWSGVLQEVDAYREAQGLGEMPVVFTELGYTARAGSTLAPWSGSGYVLLWNEDDARVVTWNEQPEDRQERALAVRALHDALSARDDEILRGLLYWKLTTNPAHREIEPFVHVLGAPDDPLGRELRRFRGPM